MPARAFDFIDVKGVVEQVLARFEMRAMYFDHFPADAGITPEWLHPYRAARVVADGLTVGWFGQLHPREAAARKIKDAVLMGEIYLDRLYKLPLRRPMAREISRYQPVRRDFSLVLDESIAWETIDQRDGGAADSRSLWSGGCARCSATRGWARASMRCCWARPSRRRTARCAKRSCRAFRRGWWKLLARRERGCAFERNTDLAGRQCERYTRTETGLAAGGGCDDGIFWESEQRGNGRARNSSRQAHEEPAALAVSVDDFAALEERMRRAVEVVKRERQARAEAEAIGRARNRKLARRRPKRNCRRSRRWWNSCKTN